MSSQSAPGTGSKSYASPIFVRNRRLLPEGAKEPVCGDCPVARWYVLEDKELECFCDAFRGIIYGRGRAPVTDCDAREDAIDQEVARRERNR